MLSAVAALLVAAAPSFAGQLAVSGPFASGQACAVTEHLALTARHVVETDDGTRIEELRGSNGDVAGYFTVVRVYEASDLAALQTELTLTPYPLAEAPPREGDKVWMQGYDWRNEKDMYQPRVFESTVTRSVAGVLHYVPGGMPGTSGSCVLNEKGELVAIDVNKRWADNRKPGGGGVAVYGVWKPTLPD